MEPAISEDFELRSKLDCKSETGKRKAVNGAALGIDGGVVSSIALGRNMSELA
jgi:hypothetical protein